MDVTAKPTTDRQQFRPVARQRALDDVRSEVQRQCIAVFVSYLDERAPVPSTWSSGVAAQAELFVSDYCAAIRRIVGASSMDAMLIGAPQTFVDGFARHLKNFEATALRQRRVNQWRIESPVDLPRYA